MTCDQETLRKHLTSAGLEDACAAGKARLFVEAAQTLWRAGGDAGGAAHAMFVPGRVELVGKHVDYAGGHSITCAVDRGFCLIVQPRDDRTVRVLRADGGGDAMFELDPDLALTPGHWSNYAMSCARRVARNFPEAQRGADIALHSDLPPAAGLSSSSAMITAIFFALMRANALEQSDTFHRELATFGDLAGYLGALENGATVGNLAGDAGVGTFGGSQDHTAIIGSRAGQFGQFAYCPVQLERYIAMPADCTLAIAVSGVEAAKTGGAMASYNNAAQLARDAAAVWQTRTEHDDARLADALRSGDDAAARIAEALADRPALRQRFDHFYAENEQIVPAVGDALARGDLAAVGDAVDRSQQLAEQWLGNQVEATTHLARGARRLGAAAASAFGAGFGGSVWAMVRTDEAAAFLEAWARDYRERFRAEGRHAVFFQAQPGPAAFELGRGRFAEPGV